MMLPGKEQGHSREGWDAAGEEERRCQEGRKGWDAAREGAGMLWEEGKGWDAAGEEEGCCQEACGAPEGDGDKDSRAGAPPPLQTQASFSGGFPCPCKIASRTSKHGQKPPAYFTALPRLRNLQILYSNL